MTKNKKASLPNFVETNRPRHEYLDELIALNESSNLLEYQQRLNALGRMRGKVVPHVVKPKTLMEMYQVTPDQIYVDTLNRPKHYTPEQLHLAEALKHGRKLYPEPRTQDYDDLFMRWMERTEHTEKRQEIVKKITDVADDKETELEGANAQSPDGEKKPSFEEQNYGKLTKLI